MIGKRKAIGTLDPAAPNGPHPFGAAPPSPGVSDLLRERRESLGYELADVATMLRIRYPYLRAIEAGRFEELPGATYAAGFMRSYAEYLGLDPEMVVVRYKEEASGRARSQQLYFPTPVPENRVPGGTVLLGALVLAGVVYGGWYYLSATDRSMVDLVPALPDRLVSLLDTLPFSSHGEGTAPAVPPAADATSGAALPAPAMTTPPTTTPSAIPSPGAAETGGTPQLSAAAGAKAPASATPVPAISPAAAPTVANAPAAVAPAAPAKTTPTPATPPASSATASSAPAPSTGAAPSDDDEDVAQDPTPLTPSGAPAAVAALPPPPPPVPPASSDADSGALPTKVYGAQNQSSRIQLRATQDSWVQVRDGNGDIIFTRVLKPGDVYRVPDHPGVRLRTGNAGGLEVVTDGVNGGPLGSVGQVMRDVALDQHTPGQRGSAAR